MKSCLIPLLAGFAYLSVAFGNAFGAPAEQPNILWVIAEDACADFGCYGNAEVQSPNIDRLAAESCLYRRAFTTGSVCSTSRSALMTGLYQTRIGAHNHRSRRGPAYPRPPAVRLITERFRDTGYFTANIRKLPQELGFNGSCED